MYRIAIIRGDGIGPEVVDSALEVLRAVEFKFEEIELEAGLVPYKREGNTLPRETLEASKECDSILFGAVDTLKMNGESAIVSLRKKLDLFANVRPIRSEQINLAVIRENTECLYIGEEYSLGDYALATRRISKTASERIAKYAYEYAQEKELSKVTVVHKANILRKTCGMFRDSALRVAEKYPKVETEEMLVDNAAMQLVLKPEQFQVILTTNMFGDILSDEAAGLVGGLGLAASANIGERTALFEPVHGSAPDIVGKGIANPTAAILSGKFMLEYLGESKKAELVGKAIENTLQTIKTRDLEGNVSTEQFTKAIVKEVSRKI